MENRNSVNNSGIGILCSKNSNERLAVPAVAGLLVCCAKHLQERIAITYIKPAIGDCLEVILHANTKQQTNPD